MENAFYVNTAQKVIRLSETVPNQERIEKLSPECLKNDLLQSHQKKKGKKKR